MWDWLLDCHRGSHCHGSSERVGRNGSHGCPLVAQMITQFAKWWELESPSRKDLQPSILSCVFWCEWGRQMLMILNPRIPLERFNFDSYATCVSEAIDDLISRQYGKFLTHFILINDASDTSFQILVTTAMKIHWFSQHGGTQNSCYVVLFTITWYWLFRAGFSSWPPDPLCVPSCQPPGPTGTHAPITSWDSVFDTILLASYHYCLQASSVLIINPFLLI